MQVSSQYSDSIYSLLGGASAPSARGGAGDFSRQIQQALNTLGKQASAKGQGVAAAPVAADTLAQRLQASLGAVAASVSTAATASAATASVATTAATASAATASVATTAATASAATASVATTAATAPAANAPETTPVLAGSQDGAQPPAHYLLPGQPGAGLPVNYLNSPLYKDWQAQKPTQETSGANFGRDLAAWQRANPYYVDPGKFDTYQAYLAAVQLSTASGNTEALADPARQASFKSSYYGAAYTANPWGDRLGNLDAQTLAEMPEGLLSYYQKTVEAHQ